MKPTWLLASVLVVALISAACQSDASPETAAPVPAASPEATAEATAESTTAPVATATPEPSAVPSPVPSPEPTATTQPVPSTTPVRDVIADALAISRLEPVPCPAGAQAGQVSCALAVLPADASDPDPGRMVQIMTAWVDNGDPLGIGPVVFLQGGPGIGSVANAARFVGGDHDLLFVDQRGTGSSIPKLDCPELEALWQAFFTDDESSRLADGSPAVFDTYQQCHDRLVEQGISLAQYNTQAASIDLELIRRLRGHESWSLWGISYGTRLALNVIRDFPQGVRAAVLDSVVPFEVDFFATIPENGLRSIRALDQACDASACADSHGDFLANLSDLALRLNEEPVVVTATRPESGVTFPFRVNGDELINMVFTQLYSTRSLRSLPRQIDRADFGGIEEMVATYVSRRDPDRLDLSTALYYATWCREEFPFHDEATDDETLAQAESLFGSSIENALGTDGIGRFCDIFSVPPAPDRDDLLVISDIPALIFAGAFDPITPPAWSQQVAQEFMNATYVELADHGHGMSTACPRELRYAFLAAPDAELDTTCALETAGPVFE